VLHKKGLALDGRNPVLVHGYASYGLSMTAHYSPDNLVWLERGGVLAFTNPRGSGVHGKDWHRAGFKATKPNTWKDGIACVRWLIEQRYGSPATMGIMGTSAGGIFVGRAVTEAPELFAAAIFNVGALDSLRFEHSANGATNVSEFGTTAKPDEFRALMQMSTYHQVRDGVSYPAVMLTHGLNDPRVPVWESAKTAARLQAGSASGKPVLLRLDLQAGHGVGSTLDQRVAASADQQAFLLWQMGKLNRKD
jgi:prolyl oligopeptidase